ncbi:MAG: 4Fe-4S binding protein [Propionibacteriaceae bacterium]|nr:4Fe-4S binding protein [Propionibacteriaceae bacterium]
MGIEGRAPERPKLSRFQRRTREIRRVKSARGLTQLVVGGAILVAGVRHQLEKSSGAASVDALCPFGAVETLLTWVTTGGLISKIHPSNLVLGLALLIATLLVGNAFCGWICPFGALQDALTWVRRKLNLPSVTLPRTLDRALRWGRFVVLAVVLYFSYTTAKLWFADYDPYVTLFGLHWLFGAESSGFWIALLILGVVAAASVVIDRFWCRYLCPLGAVFAVVGRFSLLRLRRSAVTCTDCTLCDKPCPVGIEPSKAKPFVSSDCIGCMDCVATCPVPGALTLRAPVLLGIPSLSRSPEPDQSRTRRQSAHVQKES